MAPRSLTEADLKHLQTAHRVRIFPAPRPRQRTQGTDATFEAGSQHPPEGMMNLGAYSYSGSYVPELGRVGRYCSIGKGVRVIGPAHPVEWASTSPIFFSRKRVRLSAGVAVQDMPPFETRPAPVTIGHDVWIGDNVAMSGGITIGHGAVLAYGAIVTKDVPPYTIVGGSPAKKLRARWTPALVKRALASEWWTYDAADLLDAPAEDPKAFLDFVEDRADKLRVLPETWMTLDEALTCKA